MGFTEVGVGEWIVINGRSYFVDKLTTDHMGNPILELKTPYMVDEELGNF